MVSINRVAYFIVQGNTYGNLATLRNAGATYDNGGKYWKIPIERHPLNNAKQKKKLLDMLNTLEENGCRFTAWFIDGGKQ